MKKWEYIVKAPESEVLYLIHMLNDMGEEGWELCSDIGGWLFFKREKKDA